MTMDRDERITRMIRKEADRVRAKPELRRRIDHDREGGARRVPAVALAVVLLLVAGAVAFRTLGRDTVVDVTATPSPPVPGEATVFPGFWPGSSYEEAQVAQETLDAGGDEWRADAAEVASRFADEVLNWFGDEPCPPPPARGGPAGGGGRAGGGAAPPARRPRPACRRARPTRSTSRRRPPRPDRRSGTGRGRGQPRSRPSRRWWRPDGSGRCPRR
jgi:hypothetical protein